MKNICVAVLVVCATVGSVVLGIGQSEKMTNQVSPGLEVGEKVPSFRLKDQFGHNQSNETLQGENGTVLLFVRSADL